MDDKELLAAAIKRMDPEADRVVEQAFGKNSVEQLNQALARFVASRDIRDINNPPPAVMKYIDDIQKQVAKFDQARIKRGQDLFNTHVGICAAALTVASLPEAYAMASSGRILGRTQRLAEPGAFKRVAETSQFVLRVMTDRGLECLCDDESAAMGTGAVLRVRLMHAAIRCLIKQRQKGELKQGEPDYSHNEWVGEPINQVELLFTLLCFAWVTLRAMRQAYQEVSSEEAEDYIYLWGCVGTLMGIDDVLIPGSVDQAHQRFEQLKTLHKGPSADGARLTLAALSVMERMLSKKTYVPNRLSPSVALILMAQFVDTPTRELLQVRRLNWFERRLLKPVIAGGFSLLAKVYGLFSSRRADDFKAELGFMMLEYFTNHPDEVGVPDFSIPIELADQIAGR